MNKVEVIWRISPFVTNIINLKPAVWRAAHRLLAFTNPMCIAATHTKSGWIGERSVPITVVSGYSSAKSIAQIPVPVPMSRTLCHQSQRAIDDTPADPLGFIPQWSFLKAQDVAPRQGGGETCDVYDCELAKSTELNFNSSILRNIKIFVLSFIIGSPGLQLVSSP